MIVEAPSDVPLLLPKPSHGYHSSLLFLTIVAEAVAPVNPSIWTAVLPPQTVLAEVFPINTLPLESMRSLSLPPVSAVIVSAAGNLIAVLVSPV